jgi:hypothetical protein
MIIGFFIAAAVLALSALRQHRVDARGGLLEESPAEHAPPPGEPREASAHPSQRIA